MATHNDPERPEPGIVNRAWGTHTPDDSRPAVAFVGNRVVSSGTDSQPIPLAGGVLLLPRDYPFSLPAPGDRLRFHPPPGPHGRPVRDAMAGGPLLLDAGRAAIRPQAEDFAGSAPPVTFSQDETLDQNRLPRMAAGIDAEGTLFFAAIDGRNFERAPGFTLGDTAQLMAALGCRRALNLDGGSSKRMVVAGEVVDLPSTELVIGDRSPARVRPVYTGILVFPS